MASPPIHFDSDPSLMAGNPAQGNGYGGYQNIYGNMNFNHSSSYPVPSPSTPPSLPPVHNAGAYAPNGNFQFSYHPDNGSVPPTSTGVPTSAASSAPLSTPTGTQPSDAQHSPHAQQPHQLTPPQQHPQTPQQGQPGQQHAQPQRQAHQAGNIAQSPYQQSPQAHHPGMNTLMQGHPIYPGDTRYDSRLQQPRYMDPNMQPMMNRNGPHSGGDISWNQPGGMMPDLLGGNHPGGAIRNAPGPQGRAPVKQNMAGMNGMAGMGMNGMNGMGGMGALGGMPGMPNMNARGNDRMGGWTGGMVGAPQSPYGHPSHPQQGLQHQQPFHHLQQNPYQQPHLLQHQPGMQQHMGMHGGRPGNMGPVAGGGISKKKLKKTAVPVVKDKNCPKRPRNSYIFFTLMKRDDIKKKHPEFKPTEITKMLGEEWQKLSEAEKESYGSMAEDDKKRYQSEMEAYDANGGANAAAANDNGHAPNGAIGNGPPGPGGDMGGDHWRA
ncbi:non-histone protein [Mortierella sp. 14UC]|nr:non-histone protein [Mortierella sp. 14UC]